MSAGIETYDKPAGYPLALPGTLNAARFVGATTSGPPSTGSFRAGDFVIDQSGAVWICTVAGSPGTWQDMSSGKALDNKTSTASQTGISTTYVDITGLTSTFTVTQRPVEVVVFLPWVTTSAATTVVCAIRDASNVDKSVSALQTTQVTGNVLVQIGAQELITTPGTYTRKVSLARSGGSGTLANNSGLGTTISRLKVVNL